MIDFLDKIGNALGILFIIGIIAVMNVALRDEPYLRDSITVKKGTETMLSPWGR